jgi:hypothetical protein
MIELTLQQLFDWTKLAVDAGVQSYIKTIEPASDRIKQAEAKRYIANLGYSPTMLHKWVEAGLLSRVKSCDKQNASAWYSLAEIKNLLGSIKLKELCNNQD